MSKKGFLDCGSSRGRSETVFLYECRDYLTAHLNIVFCRVQTSNSTRSSCKGLASNIFHMNKFTCLSSPSLWSWIVLETFKVVSVPKGHKGTPTSVKSRNVINPTIAKEVFQLFGISVPIGSRKYKTHNVWKISLS